MASDTTPERGRPVLAVVGGKLKIVRKARELGLGVVYVQHPDKYDRSHWPYVDQALLVDYTDSARLLPLLAELHRVHPFQRILSLTELGLVPTAEVDELLGLGGNPLKTVDMLMDKAKMRQHLNALGISPVAAVVGETGRDVLDFAREHGFPVVVKPTSEAGSLAVSAVRGPSEIGPALERVRALGLRRFLVEEYLEGPEISVETLSFDGRHVVVGTTDKVCVGFVEIGHSMPSAFPAEVLREAEDLVVAFLDAVGLRHGPAHTELKLTDRGPVVVESHNRVGGDRINELAQTAYGVDMDLYAIGAPLGVVEPLRERPEPLGGAAVRFLVPAPGRVVSVAGVDAVRRDPALVELEVSVEPGDEVPPLVWSEDRVGLVVARGTSAADAVEQCERLASMVEIGTERDAGTAR
ncbi:MULTISPECIES: ATP-grasp domain-containing protein [Actinosynnema]|uniref:ATP-grasp domain-containing protein n=1 Tax=Actinosynnema TaxID=40566 RepID=UPI0020A487C6|nr:ATP-grasp domain-containing protein [Actinosynnema pretiosum]MCP2097793.1 Biotin carboxylase [Actinosynnema pretiosum]